jgi:hypothetical protein
MTKRRREPPPEVFGQCEAWEVETIWDACLRLGKKGLFAEAEQAAKEAPRRCRSFGRMVIETDMFGRKRQRIICWYHGLDTAPAAAIVPLFPEAAS